MANTARPTTSHGHHVVPSPSPPPSAAVVVAAAVVSRGPSAVVVGASVAGRVVPSSLVGRSAGRVTPDAGVLDPPPEPEHEAPRIAMATTNAASTGRTGRVITSAYAAHRVTVSHPRPGEAR